MASNFGIAIDKNSDGFGLKLEGNFDATSACELIWAITIPIASRLKVPISAIAVTLPKIAPFLR